jgi:group I intron endonuclease
MTISGIYKIQSIINPDRVYIGSAVKLSERKNTHLWLLRKNKHHSKKLQRHYNKYGENDLVFSVLIECDKLKLIRKEQCYMNIYKPYFNCCEVSGSRLGYKESEEVKKKLSDASKGKPKSQEMKDKLKGNKNALGFKHTKETCDKHRHPASEETKRKMREHALKNKDMLLERLNKGRKYGKGTGTPVTEEHKEKLRRIMIERWKLIKNLKHDV